jgi:hypothetical protein
MIHSIDTTELFRNLERVIRNKMFPPENFTLHLSS